jgi:hypothetical protein
MKDNHKTSQRNGEQSSNPSYRLSFLGVHLAVWCVVGIGLAGPSQSPAQSFRIESSQLGPQSQPSFSMPSDTNSYYRLLGGEQITNLQNVIALSLSDTLVSPQAPTNAQFFYRAQRIALAAPHDSDGDGIDDLWELGNGLDPLDPSDAARLDPGDTRSWLEIYNDEKADTFDYQYPLTQSATFKTLAQDPLTGAVYAAGYMTTTDGTNHALVLKSTDGGMNWETNPPLLDYPLGTTFTGGGGFLTLAADASGNLYVAAQTGNPPGVIVLKGVGGGTNWSLTDQYSGEPSWGTAKFFDSVCSAADRDGNVYVAARAAASGKGYWFVRKFTASSNSWATVDVFVNNGYGGWPTAVACDRTGKVFVVGIFALANYSGYTWGVRRSLDGGASWKTVDTFQLDVPPNMWANEVTTDAKGNVYVVGYAWRSSGIADWLVRASTDGGNTWRTIDDPPLDGNGASASSIGVDSMGRLNVLGGFLDTSGIGHSLLRRSSDGGATWVNVDDVVGGPGTSILALPDGSTLAGAITSWPGWQTRRLPPPPPR